MPERVTFKTIDGVTIAADWQPTPRLTVAAVLVHMMPETRSSWAGVQRAFLRKGIATLAIDLRGHGESTQGDGGVVLNYQQFTDEDHQSSVYDVRAAVAWLASRGLSPDQTFLVGASFGANLCLATLTEEPRLPGAILLSPGEDYRGVKALEDVQDLLEHQSLYVISAEDDARSFTASNQLYADAPVTTKTFQPYKVAGHGTSMLNADSSLPDKMADWILKQANVS